MFDLTIHDDGEWIGVDIDGERLITHESSVSFGDKIGLMATGSGTFDEMYACGRAGCDGATDEWTWDGDEWGSPSGACPSPCTSQPPIQAGEFVDQTLPGRCGKWSP